MRVTVSGQRVQSHHAQSQARRVKLVVFVVRQSGSGTVTASQVSPEVECTVRQRVGRSHCQCVSNNSVRQSGSVTAGPYESDADVHTCASSAFQRWLFAVYFVSVAHLF